MNLVSLYNLISLYFCKKGFGFGLHSTSVNQEQLQVVGNAKDENLT